MKQKRCYKREFRLRPDRIVVQIFLYALAYTAQKYGILLHEFVGLSTHDHLLLSDPRANRPAFLQLFHSLVARAVNAHFGEWDALWSTQAYSAPRLLSAETTLRKIIYVLLNPVEALLVRYVKDWRGPTSWNMEYGVPIKIKRPPVFFSKDMPDEVELVIHRPPDVRTDLTDRELRTFIRKQVEQQQSDLVAEIRATGGTFLGMKRVLKADRHSSPKTPSGLFGMRPTVAGKEKQLRIEALRINKKFLADHETSRLAFKAGNRDVVFPHGTYLMRVRYGCACASP